jgi:hypothetical protein
MEHQKVLKKDPAVEKCFSMELSGVKLKAVSKVPHLLGIGWPQIAAMGLSVSPILSCMTEGWIV